MPNLLFSIFPNQYFIDLCLYQYGYERCKPLSSFGPYIRNHYLFHYVISGSGTLVAMDQNGIDQTYHIRSGQGFMIFPNQNTSYYADSEHPWEYAWIEFDGARVEEILMNCNISIKKPIYYSSDKTISEKLKNSLLELASCENTISHFGKIGLLYTCIDYLIRSSKNRRAFFGEHISDTYVKEAVHFINKNFHNDISVEDIANFCNISRGYLCKILKKHTGQSPQQLLMNYRMSKAAQLLEITDLSIGDIGKTVGYENQLHFSRAFKTIYGISPLQWRKKMKNIES